jgi:hypothetical protein
LRSGASVRGTASCGALRFDLAAALSGLLGVLRALGFGFAALRIDRLAVAFFLFASRTDADRATLLLATDFFAAIGLLRVVFFTASLRDFGFAFFAAIRKSPPDQSPNASIVRNVTCLAKRS